MGTAFTQMLFGSFIEPRGIEPALDVLEYHIIGPLRRVYSKIYLDFSSEWEPGKQPLSPLTSTTVNSRRFGYFLKHSTNLLPKVM